MENGLVVEILGNFCKFVDIWERCHRHLLHDLLIGEMYVERWERRMWMSVC